MAWIFGSSAEKGKERKREEIRERERKRETDCTYLAS